MYTLQHWGLAKFIFGPGGINLSFAAVRREQVYSSSFPFAARIQFCLLTSPHLTKHLIYSPQPYLAKLALTRKWALWRTRSIYYIEACPHAWLHIKKQI